MGMIRVGMLRLGAQSTPNSIAMEYQLSTNQYSILHLVNLYSSRDISKDKETNGQAGIIQLTRLLDCKSCTTVMMCVGHIAAANVREGGRGLSPQCDILLMGSAGN